MSRMPRPVPTPGLPSWTSFSKMACPHGPSPASGHCLSCSLTVWTHSRSLLEPGVTEWPTGSVGTVVAKEQMLHGGAAATQPQLTAATRGPRATDLLVSRAKPSIGLCKVLWFLSDAKQLKLWKFTVWGKTERKGEGREGGREDLVDLLWLIGGQAATAGTILGPAAVPPGWTLKMQSLRLSTTEAESVLYRYPQGIHMHPEDWEAPIQTCGSQHWLKLESFAELKKNIPVSGRHYKPHESAFSEMEPS